METVRKPRCRHTAAYVLEQTTCRLKVACQDCGISVEIGIPVDNDSGYHAPPKWVTWFLARELYKQRRIAACVDARIWIAAKEKAGFATQIVPMQSVSATGDDRG